MVRESSQEKRQTTHLLPQPWVVTEMNSGEPPAALPSRLKFIIILGIRMHDDADRFRTQHQGNGSSEGYGK